MDSHATTRQPFQQQQHLQQLKRPAPQPPPTNNKKSTTTASGDAAAADDLHAWSLFRQNLNANFSESALAINGGGGNGGGNHHHHQNNHQNHNHHYRSSSPNEPLPSGGYHQSQNRSSNNGGPQPNSASNFQLRESTVNNILSHPKYGAQLKNQDAFTYLRFGLPRVKVTSSLNSTANNNKAAAQPDPPIIDHQPTRRNFNVNNNIGSNNSFQNNHQQKSVNESSYQSSRQPPLPPPPQTQQQLNEELKRRFWSSESNLRAAGAATSGDHRSSDFDSSGQYSDSSGREMLPTGGPRGGGGGGVPRSSGVPANHHGRSPGNRGAKTTTQPTINQRSQRDPMKPSYSINDLRYSGVNNKGGHHNRGDFNADYDGGRPSSGDGSSSVDHHEPPPQPLPVHHPHQRPRSRASPSHFDHPLNRGGGGGGRGVYPDDDIRLDEMMVNGATGNGGGGGPFHSSAHSLPPPLAKHPHLVVKDLLYEVDKSPVWRRLCGFSRQKLRVLEDVSFDVRGGELMAIMATSASEGTALLDVLADRADARNGTVRAELYLNGVQVTPRGLAKVAAYVAAQPLLTSSFSSSSSSSSSSSGHNKSPNTSSSSFSCWPEMTARQALLFAGLLMGPASRSSGRGGGGGSGNSTGNADIKRRTRTLLEELNLGEVRHTVLSELTDSERRRLHIAVHLLLDTEILMLDQPLQGLDIFDAFFLVEYLRQWAAVGCRSVVMTLSPPTYEVFTMLHRVLLLSAGRTLFVGPRRDFLPYFTALDFPCPPFKNPADYYLDLVTLDDLSAEALIESSQRVEALAELHVRRPLAELFSSMPGPPAGLPPPYRRANLAMQFLALWIRALIFGFPYNVVALFNRFLLALTLSLLIGGIFWQVRAGREQEYVWDRLGFLSTMLGVGVLPLLLGDLWNAHKEKQYIEAEVEQRFYSLPAFLLAKTLYSAPSSLLVGLAYCLPACSMAGLQLHSSSNSNSQNHNNHNHRTLESSSTSTSASGTNSLPLYLLLMMSFYLAFRSLAIGLAWACRRRSTATWIFSSLFTIFLLSSGALVQLRDLAVTHRWLRPLSPIRWVHEALVGWEFEPNAVTMAPDGSTLPSAFVCNRNPVIQQPNAILVRADCGFASRANVLKWFEYAGGTPPSTDLRPWWHALIALLTLYLLSFFVGAILFCLRAYYFRSPPSDRYYSSPASSSRQKRS